MPPVAAASYSQRLDSRALLCTLEAVRVPFLIYGPDGRREHTSASAASRAGGRALSIKGLSRRENEVAQLIGVGLSTKEIAQRLGISPHTTRHHTERIFARLRVSSRAGVAAIVGERCVRGDDPPTSLLHHHLDEEALS
jgi:DNA-binding CsgD family transcriptional regulator